MRKKEMAICAAAAAAAAALLLAREVPREQYIRPLLHTATPMRALSQASIIFGGDMMFDRSIRVAIANHAKQQGGLPAEASAQAGDFIFSCIDDVLKRADLVVANLEGPITANKSVSAMSAPGDEFNYTFTFPTSTAALLLAHNIRIVNLGNNHIENFHDAGVRSTIDGLTTAGVAYFGDPLEHKVAQSEVHGVKLAFVNYNEFSARSGPASGGDPSVSTTLEQIARARADGYLPIVYAHWGIEYATTSPERIRALAHEFVDAGAEIVIGSHPHVVEEREYYGSTTLTAGREKYIYYSLGNFIFDQYWNDAVRRGLLLDVTFTSAGVEWVQEIPVELERDRRTCPLNNA